MLLSQVFDKSLVSLNDHSVELCIKHNIKVTKQGIDDNFCAESAEFVRTLVEQQFHNQITEAIDVEKFKNFSGVYLKDSTRFQVPGNLKDKYPGNGGGASDAGIHIQFEFDLLSGKVSDLHITDTLRADSTEANDTIDQVQKGALILRDLGYYDTTVLYKINQNGAYYISRLKPKAKVYELKAGRYFEIDITKIYRQMKQNNIRYQEVSVYIGTRQKHLVRLVAELMPEEIINRRMARVNRRAKKEGRKVGEKYKIYASMNLFVSNVPQQWLPTSELHSIYRLRWQIELRFKVWKSYCRIHAIKKMKLCRFETYLYATLLFILINWEIVSNLSTIVKEHSGKMLSVMKCFKALVLTFTTLKDALFNSLQKLRHYLKDLYQICMKQLLLEKRKCHLSQEEILFQNQFCVVYFNK
jgi:hypothetical protein